MGSEKSSADNYYIPYSQWSAFSEQYKNLYIWGDNITDAGSLDNPWAALYNSAYYANTALEDIEKIAKTDQNLSEWNNIKGSALFYRARAFHILALDWAQAYDSITAATDLGIPLRLNTDFNQTSTRSTIQQTYNQIVQDLVNAIPLLPITPKTVVRPSKPAAYALLSRVYLSMDNYEKAYLYADSCLTLKSILIDYNDLQASASYPISEFNQEVLFDAGQLPTLLSNSYAKVDSTLYNSYSENDLRKTIFFNGFGDGTFYFRGSYEGSVSLFFGLAADEVYLIKAECQARKGNTDLAMTTLNTLLTTRWETGTFAPLTATDANDALKKILMERRKELLMRDLRWMDIKRLNNEGSNIVIKRILDGQIYTLMPNDNRYALPIPETVINLTGMSQNPR